MSLFWSTQDQLGAALWSFHTNQFDAAKAVTAGFSGNGSRIVRSQLSIVPLWSTYWLFSSEFWEFPLTFCNALRWLVWCKCRRLCEGGKTGFIFIHNIFTESLFFHYHSSKLLTIFITLLRSLSEWDTYTSNECLLAWNFYVRRKKVWGNENIFFDLPW